MRKKEEILESIKNWGHDAWYSGSGRKYTASQEQEVSLEKIALGIAALVEVMVDIRDKEESTPNN